MSSKEKTTRDKLRYRCGPAKLFIPASGLQKERNAPVNVVNARSVSETGDAIVPYSQKDHHGMQRVEEPGDVER